MVQHVGEDTLELEVDSLCYIDHADQLSDETMRLMKEKQIFAVPTSPSSNTLPITRRRQSRARANIRCSR
jgi:hypothetical protein